MIITLIGANFANSNIGTLSTWRISTVLGAGATSSNSATSVDRESNTGYTTTITIAEGYELGAAGITVTMGGVDITSTAVSGLTITIPTKVTGNVVIKVPTKNLNSGEEDDGNDNEDITPDVPTDEYNSANMWLSQTISSAGVVSTTGITQSNIMAKSKFVGSATITATGEAMQMALVTYNDDGSFKARGTWDSLATGSSKTYTDTNPFNVVIATKATNTSYTVEEMVAMLNVVGTSEESLWDGTIYSDSASYWVRQSMDTNGNIIPSDNATYNRSNLMAVTNFNEPIKITAKSIKLMTAIITYDAQGNFLARSSWETPGVGTSITYSDTNPFNVIIASNAESNYSLEEMLALIDVRSAK